MSEYGRDFSDAGQPLREGLVPPCGGQVVVSLCLYPDFGFYSQGGFRQQGLFCGHRAFAVQYFVERGVGNACLFCQFLLCDATATDFLLDHLARVYGY